ncbi:MAG: hypothetical protein K0Q90_1503 [Paenibacillaceae bacterium]|nr:hypothetical protein [Paenibacillaceae bacterium]
MSRNDSDWEKKLSDRPRDNKGFSDDLRRRIEDQVERREKRRRRWLWPVFGLCGVAGGCAFYFFGGIPFLTDRGISAGLAAGVSPAAIQATPEASAAHAAILGEVNVKSGLLIGLRQDAGTETSASSVTSSPSSYRTLMLAQVDGQLQVAAQGKGVLVPYGQKFWKIESKDVTTDSDELHYLVAYPADKKAEARTVIDDPDESIVLREKLLFAGNQYVSVQENEIWKDGSLPSEESKVWVRKLTQLNETVVPPSISAANAGHVTILDIFGEGAQQILTKMAYSKRNSDGRSSRSPAESTLMEEAVMQPYGAGDNWAIVRKPGKWTAQVAESFFEPETRLIGFKLKAYPVRLPEQVTSHDKLSDALWVRDAQLQEQRRDLLVSPLEDLAVVITDKKLVLYTPDSSIERSRLVLEVPIAPGEALVSAQWATGSYVSDWVTKARKYLQSGQE